MIVVSNASPLIILAKIKRFELPKQLFGEISISHEVFTEVVSQGSGLSGSDETRQADWIHVAHLADTTLLTVWRGAYPLGLGELSTILLAKELSAKLALIDERRARLLAADEGIRVLGSVGLLELGYRQGNIDDLRRVYQELITQGMHIDLRVLNHSLASFNLPPL